ncbi:MAG: HEPN domain-containing protein [Victivallaceae bacterium]|nr:HEPN domain-containing protein [Victivallaceae bacterium]
MPGEITGAKSDYDILAISSDINSRNALRSKLSGLFDDIEMSVQVIAEEIGFVNRKLADNQFFFTDIKREGKILYDSGKYKLSVPKDMSPTHRREIAEEDFKMWFGTAKKILDSVRSDARLAAFDLQQAVEMCYKTVEMVFSHYIPYEHRLIILRERAAKFDDRIKEVLPYETREQQELFNQLDLAYIGARYMSENEFSVSKKPLTYWTQEAKKMLDLTETICREKIETLKIIEQEVKL